MTSEEFKSLFDNEIMPAIGSMREAGQKEYAHDFDEILTDMFHIFRGKRQGRGVCCLLVVAGFNCLKQVAPQSVWGLKFPWGSVLSCSLCINLGNGQ